eukprot:366063-Chlamydomonas_euryale.AAC.13
MDGGRMAAWRCGVSSEHIVLSTAMAIIPYANEQMSDRLMSRQMAMRPSAVWPSAICHTT